MAGGTLPALFQITGPARNIPMLSRGNEVKAGLLARDFCSEAVASSIANPSSKCCCSCRLMNGFNRYDFMSLLYWNYIG